MRTETAGFVQRIDVFAATVDSLRNIKRPSLKLRRELMRARRRIRVLRWCAPAADSRLVARTVETTP